MLTKLLIDSSRRTPQGRAGARRLSIGATALAIASACATAWAWDMPHVPAALQAASQGQELPGDGPKPTPLNGARQGAIVERVGQLLEERYVFPGVAAACAERLQSLKVEGKFKGVRTAKELAQVLTEELQVTGKDKHLLVRVRARPKAVAPTDRASVHPLRSRFKLPGAARERNYGFERVERLDGNVGYLDLRYFASPPDAIGTAAAAMDFLANTDALIFDMRQNGGGSPGMVHFLCSYLFTERVHLNSFYFREGDRTEDYYTLEGVPGRRRPEVPVFVLTSATTFSGAEEFSYNLLTQKRATLVGETTRGGANPGNLFAIDDQLEIFIPIGRAINPITGTNWEGTGVTPHVQVAAGKALEAALALAKAAGESFRLGQVARWEAFELAYDQAVQLDDRKESASAAAALTECVSACRLDGLLDEAGINSLGYDLLGQGRHDLAVAALAYNTTTFPKSANTFDSLGEALRSQGNLEAALKNYGRALELDPTGTNAEAARNAVREIEAELVELSRTAGKSGR